MAVQPPRGVDLVDNPQLNPPATVEGPAINLRAEGKKWSVALAGMTAMAAAPLFALAALFSQDEEKTWDGTWKRLPQEEVEISYGNKTLIVEPEVFEIFKYYYKALNAKITDRELTDNFLVFTRMAAARVTTEGLIIVTAESLKSYLFLQNVSPKNMDPQGFSIVWNVLSPPSGNMAVVLDGQTVTIEPEAFLMFRKGHSFTKDVEPYMDGREFGPESVLALANEVKKYLRQRMEAVPEAPPVSGVEVLSHLYLNNRVAGYQNINPDVMRQVIEYVRGSEDFRGTDVDLFENRVDLLVKFSRAMKGGCNISELTTDDAARGYNFYMMIATNPRIAAILEDQYQEVYFFPYLEEKVKRGLKTDGYEEFIDEAARAFEVFPKSSEEKTGLYKAQEAASIGEGLLKEAFRPHLVIEKAMKGKAK